MLLVGEKEETILQRDLDQGDGEPADTVFDFGLYQRVVQYGVQQLRHDLDDHAIGFGDIEAGRLPGAEESVLQGQRLVWIRGQEFGCALQNDEGVDDQLPRLRVDL